MEVAIHAIADATRTRASEPMGDIGGHIHTTGATSVEKTMMILVAIPVCLIMEFEQNSSQ